MRRSNLLKVIFLVSIVTLIAGEQVHGKETIGVTGDTIKLGAIYDLTGPGATDWIHLGGGFKLFFEYINDQGGINGRKVKLIIEDDHFNIPAALAGFKKLVYKDKVLAFWGAGTTGATLALLPRDSPTHFAASLLLP